jgi:hypothetical protein
MSKLSDDRCPELLQGVRTREFSVRLASMRGNSETNGPWGVRSPL